MLDDIPELVRALPAWTRARNQPATYPRLFTEVAASRGVPAAAVLAQAGLRPDALDDPAGRLSFVESWQVFAAVLTLTADPALGFETGQRLPLTAHGSLGYALMCASTARDAMHILERYWHLRGRGVLMRVQELASESTLFFELLPELPIPVPLRDLLFSSMLTSMYSGIRFLLPVFPAAAEIWLPGPEPAGFARWRDTLPVVRFGMPVAGLRLTGDVSSLDRPLLTANPEGLAAALARCEQESALMGGAAEPLRLRVRAALQAGAAGYPTPEVIARSLHLTPRTLRRRLRDEGSSYQALLEEARRRDSSELLARPELDIREISAWLGYADPANFTRAFRSWTGTTPSAWRAGQARTSAQGISVTGE
ncbi:MAG: AraC family transcriptional regulator [Moraxellaceae bacterium]|nr:AraC family transcriptional regulator [Moraxellaceae bacterium]